MAIDQKKGVMRILARQSHPCYFNAMSHDLAAALDQAGI